MTVTATAVTSTSPHTVTLDFAFPPERDEAGSTMTLRFQIGNGATYYVTDVAVPASIHTDPNLRDGVPVNGNTTPVTVAPTSPSTPNMVTYTTTDGITHGPIDIQAFLDLAFANVSLTDGSTGGTYTINKSLNFAHPIILKAADSNVTLQFTASSFTQGAINFASSHITLDGFKIRFSSANVNFTPTAQSAAIISDVELAGSPGQSNQHSRVDLNIKNLDIQAPYYTYGGNPNDKSDPDPYLNGDLINSGAINPVETVEMGFYDSGTIANNTIHGGTITVYFGPWQITGNQVLGAVKGTLSDGAFAITGGHDVTLSGNMVNDQHPDQYGRIDRFLTANNNGYNFTISSNQVGISGASSGNIGLPAPNPNGSSSGNPRNNPEVILFEGYTKAFEGSASAVGVSSSNSPGNNRRVLSVPSSELARISSIDENGLVLTILDGPDAGTSIPVLQSSGFNSGEANPNYRYFLLASPLPQGSFDIDISPAYVNPVITGNTINTSGTISTGLVLTSTIINGQVNNNTFQGDQSAETQAFSTLPSQAIRFEVSHAKSNTDGIYDSYNFMSVSIDHNTVVNAIGGIRVSLDATNVATTYGRTYAVLGLTNNFFQYSYANPNVINTNVRPHITTAGGVYQDTPVNDAYSKLVNNVVVYDSSAAFFIDPNTIAISAAGNAVQFTGPFPSSDVQINTVKLNGLLYEVGASPNPPLLPQRTTFPARVTGPLTFQFENGSVPLGAGNVLVTNNDFYRFSANGYGFNDPIASDFNADGNEVYGSTLTFDVALAAGSYLVTPTLNSSTSTSSTATFYLQGNQVDVVNTGINPPPTKSYVVTVGSGGDLDLRMVGQGPDPLVKIRTLRILPLQFQVDPSTLPAATTGVTPISFSTTYSATQAYPTAQGYGFVNPNPNAQNPTIIENGQNGDVGAAYAPDMTFQVDLPNGYYDVTPTLGDPVGGNANTAVQVVLQGTAGVSAPPAVDVISTNGGQVVTPTYFVNVTNGHLTMRLLTSYGVAYLHGLTITPRSSLPSFQFGPSGTTPAQGKDLVTNYTTYSSGLGYGFLSGAPYLSAGGGNPGYVTLSSATFRIDLPKGDYVMTPAFAATGNSSDNVTVTVQGYGDGTLSTGNSGATGSYVAIDYNNSITIQFASGGPDSAELTTLSLRKVATTGDYDGDGKADLVVYGLDPATNKYDFRTRTSSSGFASTLMFDNSGNGFGNSQSIPIEGDFFGEGLSSYALWYPNSLGGMTFTAVSRKGAPSLSFNFGSTTDIPVVADIDGDGKSDFGVYGYDSTYGYRFDFLKSSLGFDPNQQYVFNNPPSAGYGNAQSIPVVGNFDLSGKAGFGLFLPSSSMTQFTYINPFAGVNGVNFTKTIGTQNDIPMAANFDGDGESDLVLYGPDPLHTGQYRFIILTSSTGYDPSLATTFNNYGSGYGNSQSIPVVADYEGTGLADIAIYVPDGLGTMRMEFIYQTGQVGAGISYDFANSTDVAVLAPTYRNTRTIRGH